MAKHVCEVALTNWLKARQLLPKKIHTVPRIFDDYGIIRHSKDWQRALIGKVSIAPKIRLYCFTRLEVFAPATPGEKELFENMKSEIVPYDNMTEKERDDLKLTRKTGTRARISKKEQKKLNEGREMVKNIKSTTLTQNEVENIREFIIRIINSLSAITKALNSVLSLFIPGKKKVNGEALLKIFELIATLNSNIMYLVHAIPHIQNMNLEDLIVAGIAPPPSEAIKNIRFIITAASFRQQNISFTDNEIEDTFRLIKNLCAGVEEARKRITNIATLKKQDRENIIAQLSREIDELFNTVRAAQSVLPTLYAAHADRQRVLNEQEEVLHVRKK